MNPARAAPSAPPARVRRFVLLGLIGVLLGLALALRAEIAAQARAVAVLATVLDTPALGPAVAGLTDRPRVRDRRLAGLEATEARPGGEGPWPVVLFLNGATPDGRRNPQVRRLARGLARTGHLVLVPDLPGLARGELSARTLGGTLAATRAAVRHPDAEDGGVALVGVSVGASLALVAAQEPGLRERVRVVSGVAPYADLRTLIRVATTGTYRDGGRVRRFEPEPFVRLVVARSLVAALPPGRDRVALEGIVDRVGRGVAPGPLEVARLGPGGRAVGALLLSRDPARFDALYAALPASVRANLERLSPVEEAARIGAPVELAVPPRDKYVPQSEARRLVPPAPAARLTVTGALRHADPVPSWAQLGDLLALNGWVRRSLLLARADASK
jgi:pimeloyl-ACP methyl ester carboxylesterase